MAEQNKDVVFGEITKGQDTKLVVSLRKYKNSTFLDFREHWQPENKDFIPTKKGFTLSADEETIDDMIAILQKAKKYLKDL